MHQTYIIHVMPASYQAVVVLLAQVEAHRGLLQGLRHCVGVWRDDSVGEGVFKRLGATAIIVDLILLRAVEF